MRPWTKLITPELEEREGVYVEFAAWERWMQSKENLVGDQGGNEILEALGQSDYCASIALYCIMCDLADGKDQGCESSTQPPLTSSVVQDDAAFANALSPTVSRSTV